MIEFRQVGKTYYLKERKINALQPTDLHIREGEIFGLIGYSGAGKSTLLRLINRLEEPGCGQVLVAGEDVTAMRPAQLREFRRSLGMIFQHFNLLSSKTVAENVAMPLRLAGKLDKAAIHQRVASLLQRVGLSEHWHQYPAQLSGGQKQRVGIARALASEPKILLCDEATSALDPETTGQVLQLLREINRELGLTVVLITHEMDVIRRVCDRVAVMEHGQIVETGPVAEVFLQPQHATTRRFVQLSEGEEMLQQEDFARVTGRILRLTFLGDSTYAPILSRIMQETGASYSILAGRVGRIGEQPCGQLTLALSGVQGRQAEQSLLAAGVRVEVLRAE